MGAYNRPLISYVAICAVYWLLLKLMQLKMDFQVFEVCGQLLSDNWRFFCYTQTTCASICSRPPKKENRQHILLAISLQVLPLFSGSRLHEEFSQRLGNTQTQKCDESINRRETNNSMLPPTGQTTITSFLVPDTQASRTTRLVMLSVRSFCLGNSSMNFHIDQSWWTMN